MEKQHISQGRSYGSGHALIVCIRRGLIKDTFYHGPFQEFPVRTRQKMKGAAYVCK